MLSPSYPSLPVADKYTLPGHPSCRLTRGLIVALTVRRGGHGISAAGAKARAGRGEGDAVTGKDATSLGGTNKEGATLTLSPRAPPAAPSPCQFARSRPRPSTCLAMDRCRRCPASHRRKVACVVPLCRGEGTDARRCRAGETVAKVCQVMMSLAPGEEKHLGRVAAAPPRCMAPLTGEVTAISVLKDLFWCVSLN
ncbi:hypothetical protein E2C01_042198 [Portunus trituberculatus]|uniref:Uncharacterized protein n=1 Tax=Portunus trituberculatus TaxID=210409 RepID=A0A5B7FSE6_PORTR|nr:hypothetical protein [Portunus trituberculatus]